MYVTNKIFLNLKNSYQMLSTVKFQTFPLNFFSLKIYQMSSASDFYQILFSRTWKISIEFSKIVFHTSSGCSDFFRINLFPLCRRRLFFIPPQKIMFPHLLLNVLNFDHKFRHSFGQMIFWIFFVLFPDNNVTDYLCEFQHNFGQGKYKLQGPSKITFRL